MNLIECLEEVYPRNIATEKPRYKVESAGVFLHVDNKSEEQSKRTGNTIQKFTTKMTILTKNWYVFSYNFTIKIDTKTGAVSILAPKLWFKMDEEDFTMTKSSPLNSTAWRVMAKSYNYWKFLNDGAGKWYSGSISYDMGRGIKEQAPAIIAELLTNGTCHNRPLYKDEFVSEVKFIAEDIISQDEPFVVFDPAVGIETYKLDYNPAQESDQYDNSAPIEEPSIITYPRGENGVYYARKIMNHIDVELLRTFRSADLYCRLEGEPGCGKTALVEAAFGNELLTANGNGDYSPSSFIGEWTMNINRTPEKPGEFAWTDGILCRALKEGRPLLIDEATLLPSSALDAIHSATDGRGYIDLDEFPGKPRVYAKDGFYVIMAYNPNTLHGRELPEAIRSRFNIVLDVKTDFTSLDHFQIPTNAIRVASRMNNLNKANMDRGGRGIWVPQMRELLGFKKLVERGLSEEFAFNNWVGLCPEIFREELTKIIKEVTHKNARILSLGGLAYDSEDLRSGESKMVPDEIMSDDDNLPSIALPMGISRDGTTINQ